MGVVDRKREGYWLEHVRAWRSSGLSQSAYSARHGLNRVNLHYWIKREPRQSTALTLVPVRGPVMKPVAGCVLRGANGWQLEFPDGATAQYLAELLGQLR
jgi:hypothetical protein